MARIQGLDGGTMSANEIRDMLRCEACGAPSALPSCIHGLCEICLNVQCEELAAEQRKDFNAAIWAESYLGARTRHVGDGEAFDDEATSCPCCTRGYGIECNTREAWCEACGWHCDATDAPFLHSLVYEAHVRRRARIEAALKAAGVLPGPHTDE
jgi:hypothetical protein